MKRGVRHQRNRQDMNMQLPVDCNLHLLYITTNIHRHSDCFYNKKQPFLISTTMGFSQRLNKLEQWWMASKHSFISNVSLSVNVLLSFHVPSPGEYTSLIHI